MPDTGLNPANNIAVILIAAGASRRFGVEDKLRANYRGKQLIVHALEIYRNVKLARHILVTRPDSDLHTLPEAEDFQQIINQSADKGMGASIAAAMTDIKAQSHVIIALADMPDIQSQTIEALLAAANNTEHSIIMPVFDGKDGHPVIFGRAHFAALASLAADKGGRDIIQQNPQSVLRLAVDDAGVRFDIDTPDDIQVTHA